MGKKKLLTVAYAVCWVMVLRWMIGFIQALGATTPGESILNSPDSRLSGIMLLAFIIAVWRVHKLVFGKALYGKGRDPLSRMFAWLDSASPRIDGELDPERDRAGKERK